MFLTSLLNISFTHWLELKAGCYSPAVLSFQGWAFCISGFKGSPISVSLGPYHLYLSAPQASTCTSSSSSLHLVESLTAGPPSHSTTNQVVWTISTRLWMPFSQKLFLNPLISKGLLHFCSPSMAIPRIFLSPSTLPLESGSHEPNFPIQPPSLSDSFHVNSFI